MNEVTNNCQDQKACESNCTLSNNKEIINSTARAAEALLQANNTLREVRDAVRAERDKMTSDEKSRLLEEFTKVMLEKAREFESRGVFDNSCDFIDLELELSYDNRIEYSFDVRVESMVEEMLEDISLDDLE